MQKQIYLLCSQHSKQQYGKFYKTSDYDFVISKGSIKSLFQLASFIDELEKAFDSKVDVITDTSNDIGFLEKIKQDEVVVYEAK